MLFLAFFSYLHAFLKERERIKSTYEPVPYNDNEEMKHLLDAFHKFVLHGDPNLDDGLYNLPHKAFQQRPKGIHENSDNGEIQETSKGTENQNSPCNQSSDTQEPDPVSPETRDQQDAVNQNQKPNCDTVNQKTTEA